MLRFLRPRCLVSLLLTLLLTLPLAHAANNDGAIRLHPENPRYFLFRGKAIALVTSAEHYGSVIHAGFDYKRYLATLSAAGLNYTCIFTGSYVEIPGTSFGIKRNTLAPAAGQLIAPWERSQTAGHTGGGNKFDLDRWNPAFFDRLRAFLSEASRLGIIVEITPFSSHYQERHWLISPFHPANNVNSTGALADWKALHTLDNGDILRRQEAYVRKIVREANAFDNVFFEIQNEPWSDRTVLAGVVNPFLQGPARDRYPNSIDVADKASLAWQTRVAEWIASEERSLPNRHLSALNWSNFGIPVQDLPAGISVVNFHYAYPFAATGNHGLNKPIVYDETGFLGSSDDAYRAQAWNFLFSGGGGFNHLDYSFTPGYEDGSDTEPNGPGGGSPALRAQIGILSRFLHAMPLAQTVPDTLTVRHAGRAYARVLSVPGKQYAIYLDGDGPVPVTLVLPKGDYSGAWMDVKSGAEIKRESFKHAGGERVLQSPEFEKGIAFRLTRDR